MKRFTSLAVQVAFIAMLVPAAAQSAETSTAGAVDTVQAQEPMKVATAGRHRIWSHADARACLRFDSNARIARCSLKYR